MQLNGINYVTKRDMENMQQMHRADSDMTSFITNLQRKQYNVRFTKNQEGRVNAVFFISDHAIQELRRFPESIVVDATYKSNCHLYALLNFVVAGTVSSRERPDQLATIPVASAWMERETRSVYKWVLQQLREVVWPRNLSPEQLELPSVFTTDNDAALKGALQDVFPESAHLLCYIHIEKHFRERFLKESNPKFEGKGNSRYS